jgi:argininosuccinate lyase
MDDAKGPITQRLWGARFKAQPSPELKRLSRSEPSFFRLVPYDLAGSRAHAHENGTYSAIVAKWHLQASAVRQAAVNSVPSP